MAEIQVRGRADGRTPLEPLLNYLRDEVRPKIVKIAGPRSCLQTCAVVEQVMRAFGYPVQTFGVTFQIFNHVIAEQAIRGEEIDLNAPGAWARRVGGPDYPDTEGWEGAGHTVNLLPEQKLFIDLSIDQVNHAPDDSPRDLDVLPFYCQPPGSRLMDLRWGRRSMTLIGTESNERPYMITYTGVPADKSHLTAPLYTDPMWQKLAESVVGKVRKHYNLENA